MENLYKTDYTQWLSQQRELLAQRQFHKLNIENLLEAMELRKGDMANELGSHLKILLIHLLNSDYQKRILKDPWVEDKVIHIWLSSINNPRVEIEHHIDKNPCPISRTEEVLAEVYPKAKKEAIKELNGYIKIESKRLNKKSFPDECPWTYDQVTDRDWLPGDRVMEE
ncbi:DUF29 domain-containing protein [Endozoicomonas sp. SESOKO4]|uniref:DUF29 domain-containing protein n=1 Tax=Endozoicomonas sp. SESOKO4 TaxID=2828745 RepID=UPI0021484497